jgi:outer membrane protein OmpA-like peptidoglycan-associated protein
MPLNNKKKIAALALLATAWPASAWAKASTDELMAMSKDSLRSEIRNRYDAALALTQDSTIVGADNPRFLWASQAKAQCGVALGFLKSGNKDPVSIGKCVDAYNRMQIQPAPPPPPPPPPAANPACSEPIAGIVFFDWDSAVPPESAGPTLQAAAQNLASCGWKGLTVTGHTDRSGSDAYNDKLSVRRAQAVSEMLVAQGADRGKLTVTGHGESEPKVPTPDGERNPTNRRVEITVVN